MNLNWIVYAWKKIGRVRVRTQAQKDGAILTGYGVEIEKDGKYL